MDVLPLPGVESKPAATVPAAVPLAPSPATGTVDPVDAWLNEVPGEFAGAEPEKTVVDNLPPLDTSESGVSKSAATEAAEAEAAAKAAKPPGEETKPADETTPPVTVDPNAKPAVEPEKPAAVAEPAKTYAADEKIALAEGTEWTRAQIVEGLRERAALQPRAKDAEGFEKLFGQNLAEAEANWKPIFEQIAQQPALGNLMAAVFENANPERVEFLMRSAAAFDAAVPPPAAATKPVAPAVDPAMKKQLDDLAAWKESKERQEANERVQRELDAATRQYPILATDAQLRSFLFQRAQALFAADPTKGIPDALVENQSIFEAMTLARQQTPVAAAPAAVPATLGSPGALPDAGRQPPEPRAKTFDNLDDAVDAWVKNPPAKFA